MNIKKHIPNAITCCNLLCGCLAIVQAFEGNLVYAAYLVGMGAIFDFFDGFAARMLKVSSPIGKDLDSLTDMVTFGVVPGVLMFKMLLMSIGIKEIMYSDRSWISDRSHYFAYGAFIITIFSAIRLAKFNNDTRQTDSFIGVPTPAVALFICSIPLILNHNNHYDFILNPYVLSITSVILSFLLISELPLFALKFKHFKWAGNEIRFVFLGLCLVTLITLQYVGIPIIIILYILLSVINNIISKKKVVS
jgi:CDP-diacylglycerol--serine O-phosphatidyltransferase